MDINLKLKISNEKKNRFDRFDRFDPKTIWNGPNQLRPFNKTFGHIEGHASKAAHIYLVKVPLNVNIVKQDLLHKNQLLKNL